MKTVVVIGGGITGLSAMYYLDKAVKEKDLDMKLVLIEADEQLGGKIKTIKSGEFIMEAGADSIVARKQNVAPFLAELNLDKEVVYNATGTSFIHTDGVLKQIPADAVFGIPSSLKSLAKSELVSAEAKVEALKDFYLVNDSFTKDDSIGAFLEAFLGKELVEKQIAPVLSGVYSGKLQDLTIASTLPYLLDYKDEYGSIIRGIEENRKQVQGSGDKKFLSFKNGLETIIHKLEEKLEYAEVWKNTKAEKISKEDGRYRISFSDKEDLVTDYLILSTPHSAAHKLLQDEELAKEFEQLKASSLISIYMGFTIPDSLLPADGTGYITSEESDLTCNACTWTSRKWSHTSENNMLLVRLFYKSSSPAYEELKNLSEQELVKVALSDIERSLGITSEAVSSQVTKWQDNMPNYSLKHHQSVEKLEQRLDQAFPGIFLAGCSYYGVGIPDCIANGKKTAERIIDELR